MNLSLNRTIEFVPEDYIKESDKNKLVITLIQPTFKLTEYFFGFNLKEVQKGKRIGKELCDVIKKHFIEKITYGGEEVPRDKYEELIGTDVFVDVLNEVGRTYVGETIKPVLEEYKEFLKNVKNRKTIKEQTTDFRFCYEIFEMYYSGLGLPLSVTWAEPSVLGDSYGKIIP